MAERCGDRVQRERTPHSGRQRSVGPKGKRGQRSVGAKDRGGPQCKESDKRLYSNCRTSTVGTEYLFKWATKWQNNS